MTRVIMGLLAALAVLGAVSNYQLARDQHQHYCRMVEAGHWPDFKNANCEKE